MASNRWQRAVTALCVASFLLTSCTSLQPVSIPSGASPPSLPAVNPGDTVIVTTKALQRKKFVVTTVEADALVGKDVRVAYADMTTLEVQRIRKGATTALVVGVIFVVLSIVAAAEGSKALGDAIGGISTP
jgi:hypothetical protein